MPTPSVLLLLLAALGACSAEAVPEPEPSLDTKGAFVAVAADEGDLQLFRTLAVVGAGNDDDALFLVRYAARPATFDEARELAKDPELPIASALNVVGKRYFTSRDWRVVWFRSVSYEEEAAFR